MPQIKQEIQPNEQELDAFYKNYRELKEIIMEWQEKRGVNWAQYFTSADSLPYINISELPADGVLELAEHLLRKHPLSKGGDERQSHGQLQHVIHQFLKGQPIEDSGLYSQLHMALSGMLDLARKHLPESTLQNIETPESTLCPVCGQEAGIAVLVPPVGKRFIFCTACGHEWPAKRVGCIRCGSEEASQQEYLENEGYPGVEMVVCHACGESFKEIDLRTRAVPDLVWEDLRTLPLNYAAEQWMNAEAKKKGRIQ